MSDIISVWIPGEPKPQPRARAWARKMPNGAAIARVYDAKTAEGWKGSVALAVQPMLPPAPLEVAVQVELHVVLPRPKSLMRQRDPDGEFPHVGPGDCDNYAKAILDALTQVGLWRDDRQVADLHVVKVYASKMGRTGCALKVSTFDALSAPGALSWEDLHDAKAGSQP